MSRHAAAIACIVLAAGRSRRFGSDKRQARLPDGRRLLDATLDALPGGFCQQLLILHPDDIPLAADIPPAWTCLFAPGAEDGMGHSLATGLEALDGCSAALVVLADMPYTRPATCRALMAAASVDSIVVPRYRGQRGNPVVIGRALFPRLLQPGGDQGARQLIRTMPECVQWLDVDDAGILRDIDRPQDLGSPEEGDATG